jgi:hypothetical protein
MAAIRKQILRISVITIYLRLGHIPDPYFMSIMN